MLAMIMEQVKTYVLGISRPLHPDSWNNVRA